MITERCPAPDWLENNASDPPAAPTGPRTEPYSPVTHRAEIIHAQERFASGVQLAPVEIARERVRQLPGSEGIPETQRTPGAPPASLAVPLSGGQWTLVASFEEDGQRYIVAREKALQGAERLTQRERQVVSQALLGSTNKEIAYALGITDTTVRVLMARAASRLGVHTRTELLAHPALRDLLPATPGLADHG